jgi:hypothetical protein
VTGRATGVFIIGSSAYSSDRGFHPRDRLSLCCKPRNRARVDVVGASDVAERFAPVTTADRLAPLMRRELEGSAQALPARFGACPAFASACTDQFALELRPSGEDGQLKRPCAVVVSAHASARDRNPAFCR